MQAARNNLQQLAQRKDISGNARVQGLSLDLTPFDRDRLNSPLVMKDAGERKKRQDELKQAQAAVLMQDTTGAFQGN